MDIGLRWRRGETGFGVGGVTRREKSVAAEWENGKRRVLGG
jgi:hypothetical protein